MAWHGYLVAQAVDLTGGQKSALYAAIAALGPTRQAATQPAHVMHYDNTATHIAFEAQFADSAVTTTALRGYVANALEVDASTLTVDAYKSGQGDVVSIRDGTTEKARFVLCGGLDGAWADSNTRLLENKLAVTKAFPTAYPMAGNETFNPDTLNATCKGWLDTLVAQNWSDTPIWAYIGANHVNALPAPDGYSNIETVLSYATALLAAFRVTTDLRILDLFDGLMEAVWIPCDAGFWTGITDGLTDPRMSALINQAARVYALNSAKTSPSAIDYSARAAQWAGYIDTAETGWTALKGTPGYNLRHAQAAGMRGQWHNYQRTGRSESWYWLEFGSVPRGFEAYRSMFQAVDWVELGHENNDYGLYTTGETGNERYVMYHGAPDYVGVPNSYYPHPTQYYQYTFGNLVDLHLEGVAPWSDLSEIMRHVRTVEYILDQGLAGNMRDSVLTDNRVNSHTPSKLLGWSYLAAGRWSATIKALIDDVWALQPVGVDNMILPAWAIVATI